MPLVNEQAAIAAQALIERFCDETQAMGPNGDFANILKGMLVEVLTTEAAALTKQVEAACCQAVVNGTEPGERIPAAYAVQLIKDRAKA